MGIFLGLLPKGLILLGLPSVHYFPCLFFLSLPGFLLLRLPFPLDVLVGCSQLCLSSLFDPRLLSRCLMLDLFKILLWIRIHRNRFQVYDGGDGSGIDVLGGHSNDRGLGLEEEILMLPTITIRLISSGASFRLYFELCQTSHGTSLASVFPQDLGMRSLRGEYCYVP